MYQKTRFKTVMDEARLVMGAPPEAADADLIEMLVATWETLEPESVVSWTERPHKICRGCEQNKPLTEYHKKKRNPDGREHECRECLRPLIRAKSLMRSWGLTPEEFDEILRGQDGRCAICKTEKTYSMGNFMVDHDHAHCGKGRGCKECIRGLLCNRCNNALDWLEDYWAEVFAYLDAPRPFADAA